MTPESIVALAFGLPLMYGYLCRIRLLDWWTKRALPTLFHLLGGLQVLAIVIVGLMTGEVGIGWLGMAMCATWLAWSFKTWAGERAPDHVTKPVPLDEPKRSGRGRSRVWGES